MTTVRAEGSWLTVPGEVSGVLSAVSPDEVSGAAQLFEDRQRRWFCCGQGRSGLIAHMAAMRLMHVGYAAHVVGEATASAVRPGDGLVAISATGETPTTLHVARLAQDLGAQVLAVTGRADGTLASIAQARIELPTSGTVQFGGTLFEQGALLVLDALVLDITAGDPATYASMQAGTPTCSRSDHHHLHIHARPSTAGVTCDDSHATGAAEVGRRSPSWTWR